MNMPAAPSLASLDYARKSILVIYSCVHVGLYLAEDIHGRGGAGEAVTEYLPSANYHG